LLRAGTDYVVPRIWGKIVLAPKLTNSASSLSRLMISPTRFRRTSSLLRTHLYSERISSVTSHVNVPASIQSRRNEALGFEAIRQDLNPVTPATSTDVWITPLGCFIRRPNRDLRQRLFPNSEASNCVRNLGFRYTGQVLRRRFQGTRELALPAWPFSSSWQVLVHCCRRKLFFEFVRQISDGNSNLDWLSAFCWARSQRKILSLGHTLVTET